MKLIEIESYSGALLGLCVFFMNGETEFPKKSPGFPDVAPCRPGQGEIL